MKVARPGQDTDVAGMAEEAIGAPATARVLRMLDLVGAGEQGLDNMILRQAFEFR
jgi:hypothetical protein